MRHAACAGFVGALCVMQTLAATQAAGQSAVPQLSASEISALLRGAICTSRVGATFTFTRDGHYAYDGLWQNRGHYSVSDGAVIIRLDDGLERSFAVSRENDLLYIEKTVIACKPAIAASQ